MAEYVPHVTISINEKLYLKNPELTDLGKKIIEHSILLIDGIGFDGFTFKKLAQRIQSTEASIYRYFENKHKLLQYILSWYWTWMEYKILFKTNNLPSSEAKLRLAIQMLSDEIELDDTFQHINEKALYQIVVAESSKAYLTKNVDSHNKDKAFNSYKRLCALVADFVLEITPNYPYAHALISTVIETSHNQRFFAEHLPSLTDQPINKENGLYNYLIELVFSVIQEYKNE